MTGYGPLRRAVPRAAAAVLLTSVVLVAACSSSTPRTRTTPVPSASPPPVERAGSGTLDPHRPAIALTFTLSADHATVTGHEKVSFTPDRPVTDLVFRLIANGPQEAAPRTSLRVTAARVGGAAVTPAFEVAGARAGTQGSLVRLPATVAAGRTVTADLDFTLALGTASFDRYGHTADTAWWGTGAPLLAWVRGSGWATEPLTPRGGEFATSEAAKVELTVTAPAADTVLATGRADPPAAAGPGLRRWHSTAAAVRDVAVMVAPFRLASGSVDGVPVTVGVAPGEPLVSPASLLTLARAAVADHVARLGPYPYESLVVGAFPAIRTGGVEYPGAVLVGNDDLRVAVSHEVAHMWFYGEVGDDQARDPWLDEAFATYVEALQNGTQKDYLPALTLAGRVGAPMSAFRDDGTYAAVVYGKGAAALLTAREKAGPAAFDAALRAYVSANAWRVATPADLARALARLPAATAGLKAAGALP